MQTRGRAEEVGAAKINKRNGMQQQTDRQTGREVMSGGEREGGRGVDTCVVLMAADNP